MLLRRDPAQFPNAGGRHAAAGHLPRDPVAEVRAAVTELVQVEPAKDRAVLGDQHVEGAEAGRLLGQHGPVPVGEMREVVVAAIVDEASEVVAVRQLKVQDRRAMVGAQLLQLGHPPHLSRRCLKLRCRILARRRLLGPMDSSEETYNPWSVVNLVFRHLADEGLHPVLGEAGDPGAPAAALLTALGITPSTDGSKKITRRVGDELARLREAFEAEHPS